MSEIKVAFGDLSVAQQNVVGTSQRMTAQLEDLKRFLVPMVASWSGQAADDYQAKQRQWDTAAADLTSVLARIGTAIGQANEGYQQVEAVNARRWT
ncbi:MAG: WXG100 family type VII secretion target [Pseudonocardia sp.]|nr:WXG100 family type VII secretion target [Pseudonocardia sp.]